MRTKSIIASFILLVSLASCKNGEQKDQTAAPEGQTAVQKNTFVITMNAVVEKDDSFQVFYKENEKDQFEEKNSIYVTFKGSPAAQDIVFNLPEDVVPNYIRFDYGINKEQSPVKVNNIKFSFFDKSFEIKGTELANFISFNETTVKFDKATGIITPFVSKDGTYDPMSFTGATLFEKIDQIVK